MFAEVYTVILQGRRPFKILSLLAPFRVPGSLPGSLILRALSYCKAEGLAKCLVLEGLQLPVFTQVDTDIVRARRARKNSGKARAFKAFQAPESRFVSMGMNRKISTCEIREQCRRP